ncbi:MAG: NAD(P)H-hydrate dehydratase [Gammaproteobacteria bacterium]|nr:NAD(P)H-hydrate dehydratase [Gammaproteobacteria bacterium]
MRPPRELYAAADVRALDRTAIEAHGIPGRELMERAGAAAFEVLHSRWPRATRVLVCCGLGNNAGDGYVVARLAAAAGLAVEVLQVGAAAQIAGDALACHDAMRAAGIATRETLPGVRDGDVVVDALFGIGLARDVAGRFREVVDWMNATGRPTLAIDIPSGLQADSGAVLGAAVRADVTITFIGMKQGLFTGAAADHVGALEFADLGVPAAVYDAVPPTGRLLDFAELVTRLGRRPRLAHKGDHGHVLVVGGAPGYSGAARLAAEAAARVGAGLVSVAAHPEVAAGVSALRPELMAHGVRDAAGLAPLLARASVVAIGPGLGQSDWARELLGKVLDCRLPLVVDADALNLLAMERTRRDDWVLTPHPGEAARLLATTTRAIQGDRFGSARALAATFGGSVILKGAGSLVARDGAPVGVVTAGNPGMGSGGMGDVLTGIVAGLHAQGLALHAAAELGACLHAAAGDAAARAGGERGLLAGDVIAELRALVN